MQNFLLEYDCGIRSPVQNFPRLVVYVHAVEGRLYGVN